MHGFGASAYHWRYIIPELAKTYAVYAVDLLGFGFSSKPSVVYNGYRVWSDQLADFTKEVTILEHVEFHKISKNVCDLRMIITVMLALTKTQ